MIELASKHIEDPEIMLHRLGPISRRKEGHAACVDTALRFRAQLDDSISIQYDLQYTGKPHELRYTEIFAGCGGIMVAPCDIETNKDMYTMALAESPGGDFDFAGFLMEGRTDKYTLLSYPSEPPQKVVILPGSNLLETAVDKVKLNKAHEAGAYIKPHPLTNKKHMELFQSEYGDELLPKNYSGWEAVRNAQTVYTALGSELGLCAEAFGREMIDISGRKPAGGYVHFHQYLRR